MLIQIKKLFEKEEIEEIEFNNTTDFIIDYTGKVDSVTYGRIIHSFFVRCVRHVLRGGKITTPIGMLYMMRVMNNPDKKYVDYKGTKEAREETGDPKIVVYRTNEFFFKFAWKHNPVLEIRNYTFKISNTNYRVIPEYHDLLELHVI